MGYIYKDRFYKKEIIKKTGKIYSRI